MSKRSNIVLKSFFSPGTDLQAFRPPNDFELIVELTIGPGDSPIEDVFYVRVCSSTWIASEAKARGFIHGINRIILPSYSYDGLSKALTTLVSECLRETPEESMKVLARFCYWEADKVETLNAFA